MPREFNCVILFLQTLPADYVSGATAFTEEQQQGATAFTEEQQQEQQEQDVIALFEFSNLLNLTSL